MKYEEPEYYDKTDAEAAIARNDPEELLHVPIGISMLDPDFEWAQAVCIRLSEHAHFNVRGNAILGFGHLARRFGRLDENVVRPIIEAALSDDNDYVRDQAHAAADDAQHFLKWRFTDPSLEIP